MPAARGTIVDRDGVALALTRERVRVSLAPRELSDRDGAVLLLQQALDLSPRDARRLADPARRWSVVPGRYAPVVREVLAGVRGVYLERELARFYPQGELARGVLGAVLDGVGQGGIEQRFEGILRGRPGREIAGRDHAGREIPGEVVPVDEPIPGGKVRLTLDLDLQEIGHEALADAIASTGARGGDLLVTDPYTGEVLALVSMRDGKSAALSAINAPFEPGSTLKPFTIAGLLARDLARLDDSVETAKGSWRVEGRTVSDVHAHPDMTLGEALRVSSNVGVARAAQAFTPGAQYETLRDFGFGLPTGIELPGEVGGTLRRPDQWSRQSPVSLAIGYEIGVTPLQMALAYGALANGGVLMEPRLVAEVRNADGEIIERREPQQVRRVVPGHVTSEVAAVLEEVVEGGTATAARLGSFRVAGKTGTSRAHIDGGYRAGRYYSSFVGFFPADAPQLVVFVKLDSPKGAYYGGRHGGAGDPGDDGGCVGGAADAARPYRPGTLPAQDSGSCVPCDGSDAAQPGRAAERAGGTDAPGQRGLGCGPTLDSAARAGPDAASTEYVAAGGSHHARPDGSYATRSGAPTACARFPRELEG